MGRHRSWSLKRRTGRIEQRPKLLIVCEGKVTEPNYFRAFARNEEIRLIEIDIAPEAGVPKTLVAYAVGRMREAAREAQRQRDENLSYDEVWCVFDVDDHPAIVEAKQQARDNGLMVAVSNPCFELWILLHFQSQTRAEQRSEMRRLCKVHIPEYDKEAPYERLNPGYSTAVERARNLDNWHESRGTAGHNPSTAVYQLTERLRELNRETTLQQHMIRVGRLRIEDN
jgi:hypothetical protein